MDGFSHKIVHTRCFNHANREAAARCPECGHHFCRECVSEHSGRFLCVGCLGKEALPVFAKERSRRFSTIPILQFFAGVLLLWFLLFFVGRSAVVVPSNYFPDPSQEYAMEGEE